MNELTKVYEIAGGIANEFRAYAKSEDLNIVGEGEGAWVVDSTISLSNIDIDIERQRVTALLEVMPQAHYRVALGEWGVEVWDSEWDNKLFDIDFSGLIFSTTNLSAFLSRILWGLAVSIRERVTA